MPDSSANQDPLVPPPQPTPPPQFGAAPERKKSSALKIVLIVLAIFFGLMVIVAGFVGYGVYRVSKSVHMIDSSTPITESDLGVAIYPNARQGKGAMRMKLAGKSIVTGMFTTSDSKDQVIGFYRDKLGSNAQSSTTSSGESFVVVNQGSGDSVTVQVSQKANALDGNTQIVIVHASRGASN